MSWYSVGHGGVRTLPESAAPDATITMKHPEKMACRRERRFIFPLDAFSGYRCTVLETSSTSYLAPPESDQVVALPGASWADYQRALEIRGERRWPRLTYHQDVLEYMSPSSDHESLKSRIGRLIEVFCVEKNIEFRPFGSWTLENKELGKGIEPDECYVLGTRENPQLPDLAIEVMWKSGSINKLDVYKALGIAEVWIWRNHALTAFVLRDNAYESRAVSQLLPGLVLLELASFLDRLTTSQSMREYRSFLLAGK
jgi:Uma2 family endonuclease